MALKSYQKSTSYAAHNPSNYQSADRFVIQSDGTNVVHKERFTLWDLFGSFYDLLKSLVASSSSAGMIIPMFFILAGLTFIGAQILPQQLEEARAANNYYDRGTTPLVDIGYIESREQYISNPGASYFRQLTDSARSQGGFFEDPESLAYNGTFYITIESIGINRLPVRSNVDSGKEDIYNSVLNTALAHFEGSNLPISSTAGNMVIYGHSAGGAYQASRNSPTAAFTYLSELQVGDIIKIEIDGKTFRYRMQRSKIVRPEDTSILLGEPGRKSLTLFTCWGLGANAGPGNRSGRMVITAVPV